MIKTLALSSALVFAFSSGADNLTAYRTTLLKPANATAKDSADRLNALRSDLGTSGFALLPADVTSPSGAVFHHRLYSSVILKDVLQTSVNDVERARKFDGQMAFDPSWSQDEHRKILALEARKLCVAGIMNSHHDQKQQPDGIQDVINQILENLVNSKKIASDSVTNNDANAAAKLTAHFASGPTDPAGKSINDLLGPMLAVERVDQLVHRVFFGTREEPNPISLSTVLTYRVGEDDTFVQTQDCLLSYLKDQRDIFARRQAENDKGFIDRVWTNTSYAWNRWVSNAEQFRFNVTSSARDKARAEAEVREIYEMIQTQDPTAQYLANLDFFSERHQLRRSGEEQRAFVDQRLQDDEKLIPYLESRARIAHANNSALKRLSHDQLNYVVDTFLQLRGSDLPTAVEVASLGEAFAGAATHAPSKEAADQLNADFMYYRVIGHQLTSLSEFLVRERENAAAKQADLDHIRSH